jgi:hypothetical protein
MFILLENFNDVNTQQEDNLLGIWRDDGYYHPGRAADLVSNGKTYIGLDGYGTLLPEFEDSRKVVFGGMFVGGSTTLTFQFGRGRSYNSLANVYFTVTIAVSSFHINASFSAGSQYTAISPENGISGMFHVPYYLEISVDSDRAWNSEGSVYICVNGKPVCTRENCITSAYEIWGSQYTEPASYFNRVRIVSSSTTRAGQMYLCNEGMGFHDEPIGPFEITSCYPGSKEADINNWTAYVDNEKIEEASTAARAELVSERPFSPYLEEDSSYLETDTEDIRESFYLNNTIPYERDELEIIHVRQRTFFKMIFDYDEQLAQSIFPVIKPTGGEYILRPQEGEQVTSFTYQRMDNSYDVYPDLAVLWTWALLDESQFGFQSKAKSIALHIEDDFEIRDSEVVTGYFSSVDDSLGFADEEATLYKGALLADDNLFPWDSPGDWWILGLDVEEDIAPVDQATNTHLVSIEEAICVAAQANNTYIFEVQEAFGIEDIVECEVSVVLIENIGLEDVAEGAN